LIKFLVIRFSSIGDIVLTSPVVRIINKQIENPEVHFLTKTQYGPILSNNPYIDKIYILEKQEFTELINILKYEHFDYIIDLHNNIRTHKIKNRLKVPDFSFDKLNYKKWLLVNFKKNKLPNIHIVDRYLETLKLFDVKNDNCGLDYFLSEEDEYDLNKFSLNKEKFVALVIGAKHFTKRMPNEIIIKLISKIKGKIVLLGGPEDVENSKIVLNKTENNNIINLCGNISLNQSAYIISKSNIVLTHDTGLMHIASAFKKDIISIWGNTVPEFGMFPYLSGEKSRIFQVEGLKCRPCSKIGFSKCPKKHFNCMNLLNIKEIADYINQLLQ
jgi:heptosyltransferase-2